MVYDKILKKISYNNDDTTYVPIDPSDVPGKQYFCGISHDFVDCSEKIISVQIAKFFKNYLVWQAMDENCKIFELSYRVYELSDLP